MEERCNFFAENGMKDPNWAFHHIVKFLQFQKERVERCEYYRSYSSKLCEILKIVLRNDRHSCYMEKNYTRFTEEQKICR